MTGRVNKGELGYLLLNSTSDVKGSIRLNITDENVYPTVS